MPQICAFCVRISLLLVERWSGREPPGLPADGGGCDGSHDAAEAARRALVMRVHAVGEHNDGSVGVGIQDDGCSGVTGMAAYIVQLEDVAAGAGIQEEVREKR